MNPADRTPSVPVAIIGMGCLFPKAENLNRYWINICNGVDAIREIPSTHWNPDDYHDLDPKAPDRTYARKGGFLDPVDFPALDFGIAPNNLEATDTTQLLGMMVARAALEDAGYGAGKAFDRERVSVVLGVTGTLELVIPLGARLGHPIWRRALADSGVAEPVASEVVQRIADSYVGWQENSFPGLLGNVAAGRIANRLDLGGTNCVIDAACASSLAAVHLAILELASGKCDIALSGGLDTFNDIFMYMCFSKTPALSPTGDARPFAADGDGTALGEGLGVLTLKRLDDARRDGDRIYAVIKGIGTSSDGKGNAVYAPSAAGQAKCLRRAYESAGVSPETIELVEAHGTGTKVGDAIELSALAEVYRATRREGTWCALGSVKSQIGHTKSAAGAAGLIKAALALYHKVLPPTIKVDRPTELARPGASPFYLNTEARPWLSHPDHPRRAGVSAFGFGGTNFHCVLEEANPESCEVDWDGDTQIVAFSGASPALIRDQLATWPASTTWEALRAEAARSRSKFRVEDPARLVIVAEREGTAWPKLVEHARSLLDGKRTGAIASSPEGIYLGVGQDPGGLAVLFPGQGSQYVGMLRDLACRFPRVNRVLGQAGPDLATSIYPHPSFSAEGRDQAERALRATEIAQPALGAVSLGAYRVLEGFGLKPDAAAGHSFGELTALNVGGRIKDADFFELSRVRGRLMAEAGEHDEKGGMLAAMATVEAIEQVIADEKLDLVIANRNAPRQSVLSGSMAEIIRASKAFGARGISTRALDVAAAFHSRFVDRATEPLLEALQSVEILPGTIPVFANTTTQPYPIDAQPFRVQLAEQLARPVRFVEQLQAMADSGIRTFLEVGPDARLTGLVNASLEGRGISSLALDASKGKRGGNLGDLARVLAHLAAIGHPIQLPLWDEGAEALATLAQKPGLTVKVSGANARPKPSPLKPELISTPPQTPLKPATPTRETPDTMKPSPEPRPSLPTSTRVERNGHLAPSSASRVEPSTVASSFLVEAIRASQDNLVALQKLGEQTANLHRQYLEGQDRATLSFQTLLDQHQKLTSKALEAGPESGPGPVPASPRPILARSTAPRVTPTLKPTRIEVPPPPVAKPQPRPVPTPVPTPEKSRVSLVERALFEVVAEKTGYPVEVLEPGMQLDADLGIDSIKRVEILAAVQERLPEAPVIGPEHLGTIRTLGQIIAFLSESDGPQAISPQPASNLTAEVHQALIEVVAEKTGYPVEVLEPGMQLDADLGIDSIKRVEILAAVQERLPEAPVIGPEHLGTIRTLGQIIEFLSGSDGPQAPLPPARTTTSAFEVQQALIEVVAEKTGYPVEVLEPGMQLDADLGIDSIKRVEILAAVQERLPEAPVIGPEHLGTIRTLGQIIEFLSGSDGPAETPALALAVVKPIPITTHASEPVRRLIPTPVPLEALDRREVVAVRNGGEVWVLDDGSELTRAILQRLGGLGFVGKKIEPNAIAKQSLQIPDRLSGLVIPAPASGSSHSSNLDAFRLIRVAAPALKRGGSEGGSVLVTISRVGRTSGLGGWSVGSDPTSGGLAGLAKTAGHEWPEVHCKAIDLDPNWQGRDPADAIVDEMFRRGPVEVGLAPEGRTGVVLKADQENLEVAAGADPLAPGDVVVISGGARGVTAEVAVALASAFRPTIVLLGRSPSPKTEPDWLVSMVTEAEIKRALHARSQGQATPQSLAEQSREIATNREVLANLRRIEASGSQVVYRSVDVRDPAAVSTIITSIRREFGPIRGLIHGAGVLADRKIEDQSDDQFARVYETKVKGLEALLASIGQDDLKALVLFSSSTARFGRSGQVAYASANEVLNKLARSEAKARPRCKVVSVNWGPWAGGMVTPSLRPLFEAEGIALIPLDAGAKYLVEELRTPGTRPVEVVILGGGGPEPSFLQASSSVAADPATTSTMTKVFERILNVSTTPILRSHVMDGRPVLPMALILEWLAQGAMTRHPGLACVGVDDLRVLKGVVLRDPQGETIRVLAGKAARVDGQTVVPVELRGVPPDGREILHARGSVILDDRHPRADRPALEPALPPYSLSGGEIYREILFHGPNLQGITRVEGCGELGIVAEVSASPLPTTWLDKPLRQQWLTDPLALDSAFQMMILWSVERTGSGSLPTFVGRYRQFRRAFPGDGLRVVARVTESSPHKARADVDFLDAEGDLVARIEDYECVIDASLRSAFGRNRQAQVESK